uniref:Uncharacterized protein n=1 Tax=viral metagenome TaxID=1070528 RepID=A0A6C0DDQ1_9ZZZZ
MAISQDDAVTVAADVASGECLCAGRAGRSKSFGALLRYSGLLPYGAVGDCAGA